MADYKCEVCGATLEEVGELSLVQDTSKYEDVTAGTVITKACGPVHVLCPAHSRESECLGVETNLHSLLAKQRRRSDD